MDLLELTGSTASILGTLFALMAWIQAYRINKTIEAEKINKNKKIIVVLQHGPQKIELPIELLRSEFTRAEILGRIGMIPTKDNNQRFSLGYLNNHEFLDQINQINEASGEGLLTIPCTKEEYNQFDLSYMN